MMIIRINFLVLILMIFFSCSRKNVDKRDPQYIKTYYGNGKLKLEENFTNGIKEGFSKSFFETGEIETKINFRNNSKHWEGWYYYKSGKPEAYLFFWEGNLLFRRYYDSTTGSYNNDEGHGIIYNTTNKSVYVINDVLIDTVIFANPDNSKTELFLANVTENDSLINYVPLVIINKNMGVYRKDITLKDRGGFKYGFVVRMTDIVSQQVREYYYIVNIPVVGIGK